MRFIVYAGSSIGSSILSVCLMPDSIGVGSSGAVCGLFGAKLAEVLCCEVFSSCDGRLLRRPTRLAAQERIGHEVRKQQVIHVLINVVVIGFLALFHSSIGQHI